MPTRQKGDQAARHRARLVLIRGLPASGTSTLARQLATTIPAVRPDRDAWITRLGGDVWDDDPRVRVERQLRALTPDLLVEHGIAVGVSPRTPWSGSVPAPSHPGRGRPGG